MMRIDWANPKITIEQFEQFLSPYLGDNYDGLLYENQYVYVRSHEQLTGEQEKYIMNYLYSLVPASTPVQVVADLANKYNKNGTPIVDTTLRIGTASTETMTYSTPDFTDRTCWYQKSVEVTSETLTDSGDHLTYTSAHPWWINIHHERLALDWNKIPNRDGTLSNYSKWEIVVTVDNAPVTTGFAINYRDGRVTFDSSQAGKTVKASYWHNDGVVNPSEYLIAPPMGKRFLIEHVEMQFSKNLQWKTPVYFEVWAGAGLATYGDFPDYLYDAGYGQGRSIYRSIRDCLSWFNNMYPHIPAPTSEFTQDILCFPFKFLVATEMRSDQGTLLRLYLKENTEFIGELATATIYMEMNSL